MPVGDGGLLLGAGDLAQQAVEQGVRHGPSLLHISEPTRPTPTPYGWLWFQNQHSGREHLRTSPRPISTGQLHPSRGFHIRPINPVIS
ncbi:hypothetical protein DVA86_34965, partial [Streptomyces armeniacus]